MTTGAARKFRKKSWARVSADSEPYPISQPAVQNCAIKNEDVEDEADPRAYDTGLRAKRKLVESVSLLLPGTAETDVCETDRAPGEDGRQTREGVQPVQSCAGSRLAASNNVAEETEHGRDKDGDERATFAINVCKDAGRLALLGEGG